MAKVSICIPTYNNPGELRKLLDSIAEQSYLDREVIITDDSTNAEIEKLVGGYGAVPIRYLHNEKPLGHIFNWNKALSLAEGDYIKIMFSDDWFTYQDSLKEYVELLEKNPDAGFAFSGSMQVSDGGSYAREIPKDFLSLLEKDYRNIFVGNHAGAPSGTIYRACGVLFDESSNWASDLELYLHILSLNPRFVYSEKPLVSIGLHGEQYTHSFQKRDHRIFQDYAYMYGKYGLEKNGACREYFLQLLLKYGKSTAGAGEYGFSPGEYRKRKLAYLWKEKVMDYVHAGLGRLKRKGSQ